MVVFTEWGARGGPPKGALAPVLVRLAYLVPLHADPTRPKPSATRAADALTGAQVRY